MQICVNTEETYSGTFLSISNIFLACVRRMERSACPVNVLFNACAYIFVVCLTAAPENMQTLGQLKHHELASSLAEIVIDTLVECPHRNDQLVIYVSIRKGISRFRIVSRDVKRSSLYL